LAIAIFATVVVPTAALAGTGSPPPEIQVENLQEAVARSEEQIELTDSQAAEELPHDAIARPEVLDLIGGVFSVPLENAIGPFDELPVIDIVSRHSVVLAESTEGEANELEASPGGGEPVLMESTLPIAIEGVKGEQEVLDLSLESSGGDLHPETPLVDVQIPGQLGDGIELPGTEISVDLVQAPAGRAPSVLGTSVAVYPNVAEDTDLAVSPTPTGFETFTTLRTPEAPTTQAFSLKLPKGASLRQDGLGAIVEAADGFVVLKVHPPTAIDAEGASVPVTLSVEGGDLILSASPAADAAWPILVDPFFEAYSWNSSSAGLDSWKAEIGSPMFQAPWLGNWSGTLKIGMWVKALAGGYPNGVGAGWWYRVPRLDEEKAKGEIPTSYIVSLNLGGMYYKTNAGPASPYAVSGIYNEISGTWAGLPPKPAVWVYPGNGPAQSGAALTLINGEPGKRDQLAQHALGIGLNSFEAMSLPAQREIYVEGAAVELGDGTTPTVANPSLPTTWVNGAAVDALSVNATDTGLGVKGAVFSIPGHSAVGVTHPCPGTAASPCPRDWTPSLGPGQYDPSKMPQGLNNVRVVATDVIGNATPWSSAASVQVKVDHTKPELGLSGTATEQATVGTSLPTYALKYAAADGDSAGAQALTPFGTPGTGEGNFESPQGIATDPQGDIVVADKTNQRLLEFSREGTFLRKIGSGAGSGNGQMNAPRGVAINANGDIWVAESGNKRLQKFNASGQFVKAITLGSFVEPWGIAVGPNQTLWVADPAAQKVFRFKEDGTYLGAAPGIPAGATLPVGVAVNLAGESFVTDQANDKIWKLDSGGNLILSFGSVGTGNAEFKDPFGIAIARSGNVFVVDSVNNRIQEFKPDGTYLTQFATGGSGNAQVNAPRGIAAGIGNTAVIADTANKRVSRWEHADLDRQSGVINVKIKVDGTVVHDKPATCSTSSCALSGEWTLEADDYAVGSHNVEVIASDGVGLASTKSMTVETHGDLSKPAIALSGSITEQGTLGTTRPTYKLKVEATDPGLASERQSGVAKVTVKVGGKVLDEASPGCPEEKCSLTREVTLDSDDYSPGLKLAIITARDAAGNESSAVQVFEIERDTTPPTITAANAFYNAPEGWVEQKSYAVNATGKDDAGYGVTSMTLKIDGAIVRSSSSTCPNGACSLALASSPPLDLLEFSGGAHEAELRVEDGAGNVAVKKWTMNVSPVGSIPPGEAVATLEALEATDPEVTLVGTTAEVVELPMREAGLEPEFDDVGSSIESSGTPVSTSIHTATDEISIEGADGKLTLDQVGQAPTSPPEIVGGAATVAPANGVDTVVRPFYNGSTAFSIIREASAPEEFRWQVDLPAGLTLVAFDDQSAEVRYEDGTAAFTIVAETARDATGKAVPTELGIEGSEVVLSVQHRNGNYSYPVTAGPSFETGYSSVVFVDAAEETEEAEEIEEEELDPPSAEEIYELLNFKQGDDLSEKQIRRLVRKGRPSVKVSAPTLVSDLSGGLIRTVPVKQKVCMIDGCSVWSVQFTWGTFTLVGKGQKGTRVEVDGSEINCNSDESLYLSPWIAINIFDEGTHLPPREAWYGEKKHLTYFCKYHIKVSGKVPYPGIPGGLQYGNEDTSSLMSWVYHNGYQEKRVRRVECPIWVCLKEA
jgi:NHL repeat